MKQFSIGLLLLAMGFFPGILLSGNLEIAKVGEWGTGHYRHVSIQGNYAYCAAYKAGLDIIDISSPSHPRKVGNMVIQGYAIDVHVKKNYAYVTFGTSRYRRDAVGGLLVIDITRPSCPVLVGTCETLETIAVYVKGNYAYVISSNKLMIIEVSTPSQPTLAAVYDIDHSPEDVCVRGNYAYVATDKGPCDDDYVSLDIIDVSNPGKPVLVGTYESYYFEDVSALDVEGNYAYLVSLGGLTVVDISNPAAPAEVGRFGNYKDFRYYNDIRISGNYAYMVSLISGLQVVDISDPASPTEVGTWETSGGGGVALWGNYAYMAAGNNGLQVIDVSNPGSPTRRGYYDTSGNAKGLDFSGNHVYLMHSNGLQVIDVSEPTSPTLTGNVYIQGNAENVYVSGNYAYVTTRDEGLKIIHIPDTTSPVQVGKYDALYYVADVYVIGNHAYTACGQGFHIVDISNPTYPTFVGAYNLDPLDEPTGIFIRDNYAYLTETYGLIVFDISNLSTPTLVGSSRTSGSGSGVFIRGNYAYMADGDAGLQIFDVSHPESPSIVGNYDTPGSANAVYVMGNYAYVADDSSGLVVIDVSNPTSPLKVANFDTPGNVSDVHISGDYIYASDGDSGKLFILKLYDPTASPRINLDRCKLSFASINHAVVPGTRSFLIYNTGGGTLNWSAALDRDWLKCFPSSGTNINEVQVSVDVTGLPVGTYFGTITISDPLAVNSPQTAAVTLKVCETDQTSVPFGPPGEMMHDMKEPGLSGRQKTVQSLEKSTNVVKPDLDFGKFPLYFITNKGQVKEKAKFYAKASGYTLWITKEGLVFDSFKKVKAEVEEGRQKTDDRRQMTDDRIHREGKFARDVSRLVFLNANKNPGIVPIEESKHKVNYFIGNDRSQWYCDIPTSKSILYKNLYKKIDLKVYGIEKQVEYDWRVKPGGDPLDIRFQYKNVKGTRIDDEGNLLIETDFGELMHKKPVSYQVAKAIRQKGNKAQREMVDVTFKKIGKNTYGFSVGSYDKNCELIIDPVILAYSISLGGANEDRGTEIAVDSSGYTYIAGYTRSEDFPTLNQYQRLYQGGYQDAFVAKLDITRSGESGLLYSTYLGGSDSDSGNGIAVDINGYAYVTGYTWSSDFPILNQYQTYQGDSDAFVAKIDTTKSGASSLIYCTCLGGSNWDVSFGIAVDRKENVYLIGYTWSTDFPLRNQFQTFKGSYHDVFVARLDTSRRRKSDLLYSTYLGGSDYDSGWGIAVDSSGNAYVTGYTGSTDFPLLNHYQTFGGYYDAFVTRIDTTRAGASSLIYSTYLGGSSRDYGSAIAADSNGRVYLTGTTYSFDFPHLHQYQTNQAGADAFVTMIDTTRSGESSLLYSTYLGGCNDDSASAIDIDGSGNAYVTGSTKSTDFPILHQYQTFQRYDFWYDAFITKIDMTKSGNSSLIYSFCLGGYGDDYGKGITVDKSGNAFIIGSTESKDFPVLNQYQIHQGESDIFVAKLIHNTRIPHIRLNRTSLNFGAVKGELVTPAQTFLVNNSGGGTLDWTALASDTWIQISPGSGTNPRLVTVSVNTVGLDAGTYTGTISITAALALNSPQTVAVTLNVYEPGQTSAPFGTFATPIDNSHVSGSIPVTGWVLDDIGMQSVRIFREEGENLIYIGDAVLVEGARPDVEMAYPGYPCNYKAGWGYMMLTHFLPNEGNGTFNIQAIATDIEGNHVTLGTKTIICDNANAVKPFGAIDIPILGGTASGNDFVTFGWALTPPPNSIPIDGSTITVWVDGVSLGNSVYNRYRQDIEALFPGYNNSSGAGGHFYLDTTRYENGVHILQWSVTDDAGNSDGISSRYFRIQNTSQSIWSKEHIAKYKAQSASFKIPGISKIPVDYTQPLLVKKGFNPDVEPQIFYPDKTGQITIEIKELERVEIWLFEGAGGLAPLSNTPLSDGNQLYNSHWTGFQVIGSQLRSLPIGSFLDAETGIFSWTPGPGYYGLYTLLFLEKFESRKVSKKYAQIRILPK